MNTTQAPVLDEADDEPMTRAEKREAQTVRILEAAKACFVQSGFQGASMHDICRVAGMSPGALYRYFPSKESIIEAIAEGHRRRDAELLAECLANPDIVEGIVSALLTHMRVTHENALSPLFTEIRAEALRNEAVQQSCDCSMRQVHEMIHGRITRAIAQGLINPTVSVATLLPVMVSIGEGLVLNDLPAKGVDMKEVEVMVRTAVTANVRPVARKPE